MIRAAVILCALATPAAASQCGPRAVFLEQLADRYGESRQGAGLAANGALVEVFAAPGGSWTIIVTTADQKSCMVASGQSWEEHDEPPAPLGIPG